MSVAGSMKRSQEECAAIATRKRKTEARIDVSAQRPVTLLTNLFTLDNTRVILTQYGHIINIHTHTHSPG